MRVATPSPAASAAVTRVLVAALTNRPPAPADLDAVPGPTLLDAAIQHGVAPSLNRHAQLGEGMQELRAGLRLEHIAQSRRHLGIQRALRALALSFDAADIPLLVIKGPALATLVWTFPQDRPYGDLDVLVPPSLMLRTLHLLERSGAELRDRNWPLIRDRRRGQLSWLLDGTVPLDLHWHLINEHDQRQALNVHLAGLHSRAVHREVAGTPALMLSPEDTLVHLALHTASSGGHRLVWLHDLLAVATLEGLDLDLASRLAHEQGAVPALRLMLLRASTVFGAQNHPAVRRLLGPVRRAGAFVGAPLWMPWSRVSARRLSRAIRPGAVGTARAMATEAIEVGNRRHRAEPNTDSPLELPVDDDDARRAWLEALPVHP